MNDVIARSTKKDIAVIGMSGRFPKSHNIKEFWANLIEGADLTRLYTDTELLNLGVSSELIKNEKYVKASLALEESESFDWSFFGYTKEEAALMDPQIRVMHEQAWLALEDAGYNPFIYPNKIGCFLSASDNLNWRMHVSLTNTQNVNSYFVNQISDRVSISRLISYKLNLKGPSYFIDTACSSSLVSVHAACRSLLLRECSMAMAGGVSVNSSTNIGYLYEESMIFSRDGYCRAFDSDSSGTIMGEGAGVVVLKRLDDALVDKDHIYCVIRSSYANNDGNRKVGFTAPSVSGQSECIKSAIRLADVLPEDISFIEAHGSGTKLGDPVEVEALNTAFNGSNSYKCAIGSVKSNIGHLDAASGIASFIKTALCLDNRLIPASMHFKSPNPDIDFKSGPFYVNSKLTEWKSEKPLIAGVSNFGIGGTNAHIVLEEPPIQQKKDSSKAFQLLVFSAKTKSSIARYRQKLIDFLKDNPDVDLADLAYTLNTGRVHEGYRKFIVAENVQDAIYQLEKIDFSKPDPKKLKGGIVFMFSGQGSQYYGIGKQIYQQFPYYKAIMDQGFSILLEETGVDHKRILGYDDGVNPDREQINNTLYTQPLLFLLEYAFAKLLVNFGIKPTQMIGHSLGEYVAACLSELFNFKEALTLVTKRAQLMNRMERGVMLNAQLSAKNIQAFLSPGISVAAVNEENSCVVSGSIEDITDLEKRLASGDVTFIRLKTSHAFHSSMMDPMLEEFEATLTNTKLEEPKSVFISCLTGKPIKKDEATSIVYWVRHLRETVRFSEGLDFLLKNDYSSYVEIGASKTLLSFLRQNPNFDANCRLTSILKHPKEVKDDSYYLLEALGVLYVGGESINWKEYYGEESRNRIAAPTYSFDKQFFISRVNPAQRLAELQGGDISKLFNDSRGMPDDLEMESDWLSGEHQQEPERSGVQAIYMEAESPTEMELCSAWKSLFGYEKIGVMDDFFELGGDSLKAITLLKRVHKIFNIEVDTRVFFEHRNIRELAMEIDLALEIQGLKKGSDRGVKSNRIKL